MSRQGVRKGGEGMRVAWKGSLFTTPRCSRIMSALLL
jgi:hypothetical protein